MTCSVLVIALLGTPVLPLSASEPAVVEEAGRAYTLAMEGMT